MTQASTTAHQKPPSILSLIGDTPLVEITRLDTGLCQLFLKLENYNPSGSIKDRIALSMIEAAERDGRLQPGGTIVEATAGNTGLGIALISALGTNLSALFKARGAALARPVQMRHPGRSVVDLFRSRWFAIGWVVSVEDLTQSHRIS